MKHQVIFDSGASQHMTWNLDLFIEYKAIPKGSREAKMGNEQCLTVSGIGSIRQSRLAGTNFAGGLDVVLTDVLHVKDLSTTLLSSCQLDRVGIDIDNVIGQGVYLRKGTGGPILAKVSKKNGVYSLMSETAMVSVRQRGPVGAKNRR